ncbi:MAG: hypothetical protein Q6352_017270 [Candidatus Freyrarchaeum guaymaensis]
MTREEKKLRDQKAIVKIFRHAYLNPPFILSDISQAGLTPEDVKTLEDIEKILLMRKPKRKTRPLEIIQPFSSTNYLKHSFSLTNFCLFRKLGV